MSWSDVFSDGVILAMLGSLAYPLLAVAESHGLPKYKRIDYLTGSFFVVLLVCVILAGMLGFIYFKNVDPNQLNRIVAFHIGLSTPFFLRSLANAIPPGA